jgi:hypothetical protein
MAGMTTTNNEHLIRSNLWSKQLKELLTDELFCMKYVRTLTDFPDGTTINIPSLGEAETFDFSEGQRIKYSRLDTGNYTFTFDQYKGSANSISEKFKRDSYYADEVVAAFLPRQHRALMEAVETRILAVANTGQTASDPNTINGCAHRYIGSGTSEVIAIKDFALVQHALKMANVPLNGLSCIVHPSVVYALQTQTNVMNLLTPVPKWGQMVSNVTPTGMRFEMNLFGFDIYSSNYLPTSVNETITGPGGARTSAAGVANYFFSTGNRNILPWIGGFRQMPTVYSEFNKDTQETEYLTIAEYGFAGNFFPQNLVTVITDTDQVS